MGNEASREAAADSQVDADGDEALQPQDHFDLSAIADGIDSGSLDEDVNLSPERPRAPPQPPPPQPRRRQREMSAKAPAKSKAKKTRKARERTRGHGQEEAPQLPVVLLPEWEPSEEERRRVRLESPEMHGHYEVSEMGDPVGIVADEVHWPAGPEHAEAGVDEGDDIDNEHDGSSANHPNDVDIKDSGSSIYNNTDDNGMKDNEKGNDHHVLRILNGESHGSDYADEAAEGPPMEPLLDDGRADDMDDPPAAAGAEAEDDEREGEDEDNDEAIPARPASDPEDQFLSPRSERSAHSRTSSHASASDDDSGENELHPSPDAHIEPPAHSAAARRPVQIFEYVEIPARRTADNSQQHVYGIDASDTTTSHKKLNFQCPHCPQSFVAQSKINRHMLVHAPPQFICPFCDKGAERLFRRRDKAIDHIKRCHSSQQLNDASHMTLHIDNPRAHACRPPAQSQHPAAICCPLAQTHFCLHTFETTNDAEEHARQAHTPGLVVCAVCKLGQPRQSDLNQHQATYHSEAAIDYAEKLFRSQQRDNPSRSDLNHPSRSDLDHPAACPYAAVFFCHQTFSNSADAEIHCTNEHELDLCCPVCERCSTQPTDLTRHKAKFHPAWELRMARKRIAAHIIPSDERSSESIDDDQDSLNSLPSADFPHDELANSSPSVQPRSKQIQELPAASSRRFPCPFAAQYSCSKTFKRQKTAVRHGNAHQEEYPCICGKVFVRNDNLVAHFRSKHPHADIHLLKPREKPISPIRENVRRDLHPTRDSSQTSKKRKLPADLHIRTSDHSAQPPHKKSRTAESSTSHHSLDSGIAMTEDDHHNPSPSRQSPALATDPQSMDEGNDGSDKDGNPESKAWQRIPNKRQASSAKAKAAKGADRYSPQEDEAVDSDLEDPASFCRICHMPFPTKRAKIEHDRNKKVHWYLEQCNICRRRYHSHSALRQHQIDTGHHDSQDQLPKDTGHFTDQEEAKLNNWCARLCHEHNLTESEFNDLMTDTRKVHASGWPYKFVSRRELLDAYYDVLPRRSRRSLRRYRDNHFHNGDKGANWTPDIDEDIIRLYNTLGPKWAIIAESVGRSWPSVRRRYLDALQYADKLEKGAWSVDESIKFNQAIDQVQQSTLRSPGGSFNWQAVSDKVGTRTPQQCSNHWRSIHGTLIGNRWRKSAAPYTGPDTSPRLSRMEQRLNSELSSNLSPKPIVDSDEEAALDSAPYSDAESSHDQPIPEKAPHFSSPIINDVIHEPDPDTQHSTATSHQETEQDGEISRDQPTADGALPLSAVAADDMTHNPHSDTDEDANIGVNDPPATDAELSGKELLPTSPSVVQTPRPSIALTQAFEQTQAHTSAYRSPQYPAPSQDQPSPSVVIEPHIQRSTPFMLAQASHPSTADANMSERFSSQDSDSDSPTTSWTSAKASKRDGASSHSTDSEESDSTESSSTSARASRRDEASSHSTDSEEPDNTKSSSTSARASRRDEASSHSTDSEESDSKPTPSTSVRVHIQTPSVHVERTPAHLLFQPRAQSDSGSRVQSKDQHKSVQHIQSSQTPAPGASIGLRRIHQQPLQNRRASGRHARAFTLSESDSDDDKGPRHPAPGSHRPNWARKPHTLFTDNNQDFINSIQESARSQKRKLEEFRRSSQYHHTNEDESD